MYITLPKCTMFITGWYRGVLNLPLCPTKLFNVQQVVCYKSFGQDATPCSPKSDLPHKIYYTPYVPPPIISHDEKNMIMGRPMSPHLEIYGPTLPAMTSIAQRATGIALSVLSFVVAGAELFYSKGLCGLIQIIHCLGIPEAVAIAGKAVLATVFLHHYFNAIRFVFFNLAKGLQLKTAYKTAYAAIALSIVGGVATALIGHI